MCEVAADAHARGEELPLLAALRYYEELEPPKIGMENERVRKSALAIIELESEREEIAGAGI
jgi:hypothetical protein